MDEEYVELSIDVFDVTGQLAKVRKNLTVDGLIEEILREFDDLDRRTPQFYGLYIKGQDRPLDRSKTIFQIDVQNHDELVFRYSRKPGREPIQTRYRIALMEEATHTVFKIEWQPAILGRPDSDPAHNEQLAVNLEVFPNGLRVSRRHAQITFEGGHFYLESQSPNNPTYLNNEVEPLDQRRQIQVGDRIRLGKGQIELIVVPLSA